MLVVLTSKVRVRVYETVRERAWGKSKITGWVRLNPKVEETAWLIARYKSKKEHHAIPCHMRCYRGTHKHACIC